MKKLIALLLVIVITILSSCSIDSWSMDDEMEERLENQVIDYIIGSDFDYDLTGNDFNEELYEELVWLLNEENIDNYLMGVKGTKGHADHHITFLFRMSAIYDDNIYDNGTELILNVEFTLEEEIYLVEFDVKNEDSIDRLVINHHQIMLQAFNKDDDWICVDDVCYIAETIGGYTTKYNEEDMHFEISVVTELDSVYGTVYYSLLGESISFENSSNTRTSCDIDDLAFCGFNMEQTANIENIISIIDDFRIK